MQKEVATIESHLAEVPKGFGAGHVSRPGGPEWLLVPAVVVICCFILWLFRGRRIALAERCNKTKLKLRVLSYPEPRTDRALSEREPDREKAHAHAVLRARQRSRSKQSIESAPFLRVFREDEAIG